jgi:hypothetical protein
MLQDFFFIVCLSVTGLQTLKMPTLGDLDDYRGSLAYN